MKERKAVKAFLDGSLPATDHLLSQVRTRMKQFTRLSEDIDLYIRLREAMTTISA
jgi:hypothetical protein